MEKTKLKVIGTLALMVLLALTVTACAKKSTEESAQTQAETAAVQEETTLMVMEETAAAKETAAQTQAEAQATQTPASFAPSEIHDLVSAEAIGEFGSVKTDNFNALRWIESHLGKATALDGWPNCPYDLIIRLTRSDGQTFELQPATDSCDNMLIGGSDWYCYNNGGTNEALFDLFNLEAKVGTVTERAPLPTYTFPGDDSALKAVAEYCASNCDSLKPEGSVVIPECVFLKKEDDGNGNVKVYGNFWTNVYSKLGNALFLQSGGTQPGIAYLKKTGDNTYEVEKLEEAGDGDDQEKDIKRFSNGDQDLYDKYKESLDYNSDFTKTWRNWHLSNYIRMNNLDIEFRQESGWDPVAITSVENMPELLK